MVSEGNFGGPHAMGYVVEGSSAQPTTKATHGGPWADLGLHDGVGVLLFDVVFDAQSVQVAWQHLFRKSRLLLIQIDSKDLKIERCTFLQFEQNIEHGVTVLAAR